MYQWTPRRVVWCHVSPLPPEVWLGRASPLRLRSPRSHNIPRQLPRHASLFYSTFHSSQPNTAAPLNTPANKSRRNKTTVDLASRRQPNTDTHAADTRSQHIQHTHTHPTTRVAHKQSSRQNALTTTTTTTTKGLSHTKNTGFVT